MFLVIFGKKIKILLKKGQHLPCERLSPFTQRTLHIERKRIFQCFTQVWIRQKVLTELKYYTLQIDAAFSCQKMLEEFACGRGKRFLK